MAKTTSISQKIITSFLAIILMILVLNIYSINYYLEQDLTDELIKRSNSITYALADHIMDPVIRGDYEKVLEILFDEKEAHKEEIKYIIFMDDQGKILAHTIIGDFPHELKEKPHFKKGKYEYTLNRVVKGEEIYEIGLKIKYGKGILRIGYSKEEIDNAINKTVSSVAISIILPALIGLLIAILISREIIKPLKKLERISRKVSKGDLNVKIDIRSKDEIGSLAKAFNKMIKNLKRSAKKIEDYSSSLEIKVAQRTKSLEEKEQELANMNRILKQKNKKLKELDKQKDEFISIAAHELKTPLTSIRGFAQLMNDPKILKDVAKSKHYLGLINKNTSRLYKLVVDLVDSSRISIGKIKMDIQIVDPKKIFKEIKDNMELIIKEKGIKAQFSIAKKVPKIYADPERVSQVLKNLIINAVHYTPAKGKISLKVYRKGNYVQFEVKDTGVGIPKDSQKKIFSRFYQVDSSLRRKVGGSGLGLSVSKGLVNFMKGKIWFESKVGKGTTFYFTLPIAKKEVKKK